MALKNAMALPSPQSEKSPFSVHYDTPTLLMSLKSPLEENLMIHLYVPSRSSRDRSWRTDIGYGILRAGSSSSSFCSQESGMHTTRLKDLANLLDVVRVRYTLSESTCLYLCHSVSQMFVQASARRGRISTQEWYHSQVKIPRTELISETSKYPTFSSTNEEY